MPRKIDKPTHPHQDRDETATATAQKYSPRPASPASLMALLVTAGLTAGLGLHGSAARGQERLPAADAGSASQVWQFNIPAGHLDSALISVGNTTGLEIGFDPQRLQGLRSPGLQGGYTVQQALQLLLQGSPYTVELSGANRARLVELDPQRQGSAPDGSVSITRAADAGTGGNILPEVVVSYASPQVQSSTNYTVSQSSSAAKLDLALKETPQSISVFTEKLIQDMNLTSISDVLAATPGVTTVENGIPGAGRVEYYSRGFAINSFQIDGLMTDGAAFGAQNNASNRTAVGMQDPFLYERIDIIRGSTGLTTGQGDPSASLSFVRKKPLRERQILANLQYGSWSTKRAELDFSTPLNESGTWRGRVVATGDHGKAYVDRVKQKGTALYAITELDATPSTRLTLGGTQAKRRLDGTGPHGIRRTTNIHSPNTELDRSYNNATRWSYRDFDYNNVFASIDHAFANGWQIVGAYNHFSTKSDRLYGVMGTTFYMPQWDVASYVWGRERYDNATNAFDVYLKGDFELLGRQHDFVIGVNQTKSDRTNYNYLPELSDVIRPNSQSQVDDPSNSMWRSERWMRPSQWNDGDIGLPALDLPNWQLIGLNASWDTPYSIYNFKREQKGIYGSVRLRPLEHLQVILGARYGKGEKFESQPSTFQPYGGLIYELTPSINAYVGYARVEKPNTLELAFPLDVNGNWLDPLKANTIEAGLKGGFFDNRLNLAATYFTMTQDNYPIETNRYVANPLYPGTYSPAYVGLDGYKVYGVELNAAGQITPHWQIMGGYVHQRQEIPTDFWGIETGEDFEAQFFFPKNSFKIFTSYDFGSRRQFTIGGGTYWQSAGRNNVQYVRDDGSNYYWWQGSYALYNLMARWRIDKNTTIGVNVRNLFDKTYFTNSSAGNYGAPRSITASLNMKF
ncbi:outer membrane receptor for ferric coprogen and ferric-rhodotorulic acid [Corticibacter populi]|nr:outer membrane receptor for ferric coprogen and ferric-rhodotorulic acid [Corticibacter populi]